MVFPHWLRHDWGPWYRPRLYASRYGVYALERRVCFICGKMQITTTTSVKKGG